MCGGEHCCGSVEKGSALEGGKGTLHGERRKQRPGDDNNMCAGVGYELQRSQCYWRIDVKDGTVRVKARKRFGDQVSGDLM